MKKIARWIRQAILVGGIGHHLEETYPIIPSRGTNLGGLEISNRMRRLIMVILSRIDYSPKK